MAIQFIDPKKAKPGTRMIDVSGAEPKKILTQSGKQMGKSEAQRKKTVAQRVIESLHEAIDGVGLGPEENPKGWHLSKDAKVEIPDIGPEKSTPERSSDAGKRGPLKSGAAKQQITLRLDPDIIEKFKAMGSGWQSKLNDALRKHLQLGGRK